MLEWISSANPKDCFLCKFILLHQLGWFWKVNVFPFIFKYPRIIFSVNLYYYINMVDFEKSMCFLLYSSIGWKQELPPFYKLIFREFLLKFDGCGGKCINKYCSNLELGTSDEIFGSKGISVLAAIAWFWRISSSHFLSIRSIFNDVLQLQNTRAADGKTTLVHYLAQVVEEKHPDLLQFTEELSYVERASRGQIES